MDYLISTESRGIARTSHLQLSNHNIHITCYSPYLRESSPGHADAGSMKASCFRPTWALDTRLFVGIIITMGDQTDDWG